MSASAINGTVRQWKRYPAYKGSGLSTGVQIPSHWSMMRLKHIAAVRPSNVDKKTVEGQEPVRLCNYLDVYKNDYITEGFDFMRASATPAQIEAFTLKAGDVIITKDSETWMDIAVPAHVNTDLPGVLCGYHLALVRPRAERLDGEYLFRSFTASGVLDQFRVAANGITRFGLGTSAIADSLIPLPPVEEQQQITRFLKREAVKIEALIAKKERLIELQQEKRTALISHAVTKGLNHKVPMKDSGNRWIGTIPQHWQLLPMRRIARRVDVGIAEASTHAYRDSGIPIIRSTNVRRNYIDISDLLFIDPAFAEKNESKYLFAGDLVTTRTGANLGMTASVPPQLDRSQCFTLLITTLRRNVEPRFYCYFMNSTACQFYFSIESWGAGQHNLSVPIIQEMPVPVPPLEEQSKIVQHVELVASLVDPLIAKVREAIDKLKEYRTALISAAVTGKIDVREEVA